MRTPTHRGTIPGLAGALRRGCAAALVLLAGCAGGSDRPPPPAAANPSSAAEALPLDQAVAQLATAIVTHADLPPPGPSGKYPIVIDPWIDRVTGAQIATTQLMQSEIEGLAPTAFPQLELLPFNTESLRRRPLVLLGAIEGVAGSGTDVPAIGLPGAYRIHGVLADLGSGRVVSNEAAWVRPAAVDPTPTAFYRDSPVSTQEPSTETYLRTLTARKGDPVDPAYLEGLDAQALVTDGGRAYDAGRFPEALDLYRRAAGLPDAGHQLRVYTGLYLANQALGRPQQAQAAFGRLIDYGLEQGRLGVKFLFRPGSTAFPANPAVSGPYAMWLHEIALHARAGDACLRMTGHASPTGSAAANERLSLARADRIRRVLAAQAPGLGPRLAARGAGAREPIVGSGADDASDALDRRVEFERVPCSALQARTAGEDGFDVAGGLP